MLLVSNIAKDFQRFVTGLEKRGIKDGDKLLNNVLNKDKERKETQGRLDAVLNESNVLSKKIGKLFRQGRRAEAEEAKATASRLRNEGKALSAQLNKIQRELSELLYNIPNIPHESVPGGSSEEDNEVVKVADGNIPTLTESKKPHWELIDEFNIIDFELGNKVTGAGFPFYKGKGARLSRGMVNYFLDEASKAGYYEVQPPLIINEASGFGTGQLPDKEGQMYYMPADGLYLLPTAEVPITNIYRDVILTEDQLPVKNAGYTPCFRREAGSWGAHVRGLNRLHQFDKVEIVQAVSPDESYKALDEMVSHVEALINALELPYRILRLCGGDLGFAAALTYDFEVYSAAQERWLEVSSVSNFETYQANRLKLRIKGKDGNKRLAHTLNGSALALPRIMAALLENNQEESSIRMPKALQPYLGFSEITK